MTERDSFHISKNIHGRGAAQAPWLPCLASVREDTPDLAETRCTRVGGYPGGPIFSEEKGRGDRRRDSRRGYWEAEQHLGYKLID